MIKKELYYRPLNQLTDKELRQLFPGGCNYLKKFIEKYGKYSIATFPDSTPIYPLPEGTDLNEAYLLGIIAGKQSRIPKNKLVILFGQPACGKSYLIRLVVSLKDRSIDEIKELIADSIISDEEAKSIKELVDNLVIVPKKTTRPARENEQLDNPEIKVGLPEEEVKACDITYEYSGNLYGISRKDIDNALLEGDALMIINNIDAINRLYERYKNNLMPVYIFRVSDEKKWNQQMEEAGRSLTEIYMRESTLHDINRINNQIEILKQDVVLNFEGIKNNTKSLLLRLKQIVDKTREDIERD